MSKRASQRRFLNKKVMIIAAAAIVVLGAGVGGVVWFVQTHQPDETRIVTESEKEKDTARVKQSEQDTKLQQAAAVEIANKNAAAAEKLYQDAIALAATQERKTLLYIDLSALYYREGRFDEAFAIAAKAEALNPDKYLISDWLSRLYEARKDYTNALKYYRLAAEWANSPQNKTGIDKAMYNIEIDRVSKLAGGA